MNCHEVDELAAAYVIGALTDEEHAALVEHLTTCAQHADTIARLRSVVAALPMSVDPVEPPARLRTNIMSSVRGGRASAYNERPRLVQRLRPLLPRLSFAVALLLILGLVAWNVRLQLSRPEATAVFTRTMTNGSGATGELVYIDGPDLGLLSVQGLASLPDDRVYQLWMMLPGQTESRGVLRTIQAGQGVAVITGDIPHDRPVFLTVEPASGSPQPSSAPVLIASR